MQTIATTQQFARPKWTTQYSRRNIKNTNIESKCGKKISKRNMAEYRRRLVLIDKIIIIDGWSEKFHDFCSTFQYDIREAPTEIRDSYRMYYKLKTSFLEETLSEALEDDSFDLSILDSSSQDTGNSFSEVSSVDISQLTNSTLSMITDRSGNFADISASTIDRTLSEVVPQASQSIDSTVFEAEQFEQLNEKAWGANQNNVNDKGEGNEYTKRVEMSAKVRQNVADKLFRNSSFSMRNPRKSLSKSSLRSSNSFSSQSSSQREVLPDLETILSQKSQNNDSEPVGGKLLARSTSTTVDKHINVNWLNRCSSSNGLDPNEWQSSPSTSMTDIDAARPTYGLSNINMSALPKCEPVTVASMAGSKTMLSFDMCNMKLGNANRASSSGVEHTYSYSDEDEIANSEEETIADSSEPQIQIRSIRHVQKKRKLDELQTQTAAGETNSSATATTIVQPLSEQFEEKPNVVAPAKVVKPKKGKKVVKKRATTIAAAPIARRKSSRVSKAVQHKVEADEADSDGGNEVDPFADDDSDADPDFLKEKNNDHGATVESSDSAEEAVEEKPKPTKKVRQPTKRTVAASVKPKRIATTKKVKTIPTKTDPIEDEKDEKENQPEDYQIDFGMDTLTSVPRIAIDELTKTSEVFSEYVHKQVTMGGMDVAGSAKVTAVAPNTKQSLAREKLEKRIAAGTLDENFVRINLRKKVFVRGKKTVNFSRYKKTQWRQKKAAALAGPEMDMGGCDGGVLTCFQCGQMGHFAQNCKIKSKLGSELSSSVAHLSLLILLIDLMYR